MSPRRVRDELLSVAGRLARDGETQLKQSPENPGRFTTVWRSPLGLGPQDRGHAFKSINPMTEVRLHPRLFLTCLCRLCNLL